MELAAADSSGEPVRFTNRLNHKDSNPLGLAAIVTETATATNINKSPRCSKSLKNLCRLSQNIATARVKVKAQNQPNFLLLLITTGLMSLILSTLLWISSSSSALFVQAASQHSSSHPPRMLLANRKDVLLISQESPYKNRTTIAAGLEEAAGIDFHYEDQLIYWTDVGHEHIKVIRLNESSASPSSLSSLSSNPTHEVMSAGLFSPDDLAIDWLARKLYWTDSETNRIEVAHLDGVNRKVLLWQDLDQPRALAVVPQEGLLFWTDWGEVPKIERCSMDGNLTTRRMIVREDIFWPNGLAIDYGERRVYWTDAKLKYIGVMDFDGRNRKKIQSADGMGHLFAVSISGPWVYWTDWNTRSIQRCHKKTCADRRQMVGGLSSPMDMQIFSRERQPYYSTPCSNNNGGCSHLCLLSSEGEKFTCGCPTGVKLYSDAKTCAAGPERMILIARRSDLRKISLDTIDYTDMVIPFQNVKHSIAVDYDPFEGKMYWTDDESRVIRRGYMNGSAQEDLVIDEVEHPDGVAIDWVARNMYWTDTGVDRIQVSRLDGSLRKTLIVDDLQEPRGIVVHPTAGLMFWTDWGERPRVERAALDGSYRTAIVQKNLGWPNGIAIDYETSKLYFSDAKLDRIEMLNFDGSHRRTLVADNSPHVFGLSILENQLYWTDWQRRSIERVDKRDGSHRNSIVEHLPDLMGIKTMLVEPSKYQRMALDGNPCAVRNGGCNQLCFNRPHLDYVCGCISGYELNTDSKTCIKSAEFILLAKNDSIHRVSLISGHLDPILITGIGSISSIDFDSDDEKVYWSDPINKQIARAHLNGSNMEVVIENGLDLPVALSIDWISKNLYWADRNNKRIEVSRLDGSSRKVLIWTDIYDLRDMLVDPINRQIYWINGGASSKIEVSSLSGQDRRDFVSDLGKVAALSLDYSTDRLYWMDSSQRVIESVHISGTSPVQHIKEEIVGKPSAITAHRNRVLWSNAEKHTIDKLDDTIGSGMASTSTVTNGISGIRDMIVYYKREDFDGPCGHTNGDCSHLCLPPPKSKFSYDSHVCDCATHYRLDLDGRTCLPPEKFMLVSRKNNIIRLVADLDGRVTQSIIPMLNAKNLKAISYDPIDKFLYWIDSKTGMIRRTFDEESQSSRQVSSFHPAAFSSIAAAGPGGRSSTTSSIVLPNVDKIFNPIDIAIDPYSRLLFWSCENTKKINVSTLPAATDRERLTMGHFLGTIIGKDGDQPTSLAVHYVKGFLFWINMLQPQPIIERSLVDGTQRIAIVKTGLERPTALTVDLVDNLVCWVDSGLKRFECCDLFGNKRRVLLNFDYMQPAALAIFDSSVYFVDRVSKSIQHIGHKWNNATLSTTSSAAGGGGKNRAEVVHAPVPNLSDIIAVEQVDTRRTLACKNQNGGCSSLCMSTAENPAAHHCGCPQGYALVAPANQSCELVLTCAHDEFLCANGRKCIPGNWKCDGRLECDDGSDEIDCPNCAFRCPTTLACVSNSSICDGTPDCPDAADELCCRLDEYKCPHTNLCLSVDDMCNGVNNCGDGSDEMIGVCAEKETRHTKLVGGIVPKSETGGGSSASSFWLVGFIILVLLCIVAVIAKYRKKSFMADADNELHQHGITGITSNFMTANGGAGLRAHFVPAAHLAPSSIQTNGVDHSTLLVAPTPTTLTSTLNSTKMRPFSALPPSRIGAVGRLPTGGDPFIQQQHSQASQYAGGQQGETSSASSGQISYPRETLNPPPSPVTDQSQYGGHYEINSCASSSVFSSSRDPMFSNNSQRAGRSSDRRRSSDQWRDNEAGPPPTPCTSTYGDRDELADDIFINNYSSLHPPTEYSAYANLGAGVGMGGTRHYTSPAASSPPSPATERSYQPPPPSPVNCVQYPFI